jgi:hypothetical protein
VGPLPGNLAKTGGSMKVEAQPSDRQVLAGLVERVTYQNADNGFCVVRVKARGHRDLVTLVGHAATISAGEWITATGGWVNDRTHGKQFKQKIFRTLPITGEKYFVLYLTGSLVFPDHRQKIFRTLPITGKKYFVLYLRWLGEGNFLVQILCGGEVTPEFCTGR